MASSHDSDDDAYSATNPHASSSRWCHQESSAYARHAARSAGQAAPPTGNSDLADFLNQSRIEPRLSGSRDGPPSKPVAAAAAEARHEVDGPSNAINLEQDQPQPQEHHGQHAASEDGKEIACGPLLNYRHMEGPRWFGSVLVVAKGGGKEPGDAPILEISTVPLNASDDEHDGQQQEVFALSDVDGVSDEVKHARAVAAAWAGHGQLTQVQGQCLYSDPRNTFWQFDVSVGMAPDTDTAYEYSFPGLRFANANKPRRNRFYVPAVNESMRIMFHSCNGFSVGTDEDAWSGPALWNDVLRRHAETPIHVMIGGGDQIYNDGIRVDGPLREWTSIKNPKKRAEYAFPEQLRRDCDDYYLKNYLRWYDTGVFAVANGQIAQINIWDDHDIIDGFGSYVDKFMKCDVFRGIGGTAHKYYLLFQHHLSPPPSTYTTSTPDTMTDSGRGVDPNQLMDVYVPPPVADPTAYIIGQKPGPYVAERSRSMFARLGARIAFVGLDARIERTRHRVNYPETYDLVFNRLSTELQAAADSGRAIRHLIVLLGIPIAYPRLTWLENVLRSPVIGPIKFMHRRFGFGGGLFNYFDGSVDLLDDLDDHYTAGTHKAERHKLVTSLQEIASRFSVRITILSGDVHLAALGRFYSRLDSNVAVEHDHRFMINVVSSAITNKPPPQAIANLLARRNKIHHFDEHTDETLLHFFDKDPGDSNKTSKRNHCTMPSRNYALLTENSPNNNHRTQQAATSNGATYTSEDIGVVGNSTGDQQQQKTGSNRGNPQQQPATAFSRGKTGHTALHAGEVGCGTTHKAASPDTHGKGSDGSLDVCVRVEINQHDADGHTQGYGLSVPVLL